VNHGSGPSRVNDSHTADAARSNVIEVVFDNYLSFASQGNRRIGPIVLRGVIEMRPSELANKNGLARAGETGLEEPSPGQHPLAGFDVATEDCSCILARNSRQSTRARWAPNATERTQPMLDVRLAAQGKPAVAAFFREPGFSSDYFPRIASRSSRIRRRKKYHNQGKQHMSEIAMPDICGQLAHRKTSRSAAASCP
jgi:hypothetical protein